MRERPMALNRAKRAVIVRFMSGPTRRLRHAMRASRSVGVHDAIANRRGAKTLSGEFTDPEIAESSFAVNPPTVG